MATRLAEFSELEANEAKNLLETTKHLGASAELVSDVAALYQKITPFLKFPKGSIASSNETLTLVAVTNELMMCRMLLTKAALAALRMYQGDALTHLRRAIESCAFSVRMSKHHELSRIWSEGGLDKDGEDTKYRAYRDAFQTRDVFPRKGHKDHDPLLTELKINFDLASKTIHGSVFGMANHLGNVPKVENTALRRRINFFDMPNDSLVSCFFLILGTHMMLLQLFGRILEPYMMEFNEWKKEYEYVQGKTKRHGQKWIPNVHALNAARNRKHTASKPL